MNHPAQPADPIRSFYERYPHPVPLSEIPAGILSGAEWLESCPSQFFHVYWPHRERRLDLDILIAGCGTRQAALYGAALQASRIVAVDVSAESLALSEALCGKYEIKNVDHRCLPIEDVARLDMSFDLIISTGVLHHLPDPQAGLAALRGVLRREGSMSLMLYARYGRAGVYHLQELLQRLGINFDTATAQDLDGVRRLVQSLPGTHAFQTMLKVAPQELTSDEGVTDLLLNPRDQAYSVSDIYTALERSGLAVQEWFDRMQYEPALLGMQPGLFAEMADRLPTRERYAVGELYGATITRHRFVVCRDDRPPATYGLYPESPNFDGLIPIKNGGIRLDKTNQQPGRTEWISLDHYKPYGFRLNLSAAEAAVFNLVNGRRTVREIHRQAPLPPAGMAAFWKRAYRADLIWFRR